MREMIYEADCVGEVNRKVDIESLYIYDQVVSHLNHVCRHDTTHHRIQCNVDVPPKEPRAEDKQHAKHG